jgi:chemotaxis protein MotB
VEGQNIIIKRVKKGGHGGAHGGSWKVAYADFVTAMMAFFLLLWLCSMVAPEKRARVSSYFKHFSIFEKSGTTFMDLSKEASKIHVIEQEGVPEEVQAPRSEPQPEVPPAPQEPTEGEEFREKLRREVEAKLADVKDQVMVDVFEGGVRIEIVDKEGNPMFPLGGTEMSPTARKILQVVTENLKASDSKIAIEGHTDARVIASSRYSNWELSTERASAARKEIERFGLNPNRLLRVAGYAATEPLIRENPLDPRNRRISVLLFYEYANRGVPPTRETPSNGTQPNGRQPAVPIVEPPVVKQPVPEVPQGYAKPPVDAIQDYLFRR